MRYLPIDNKLFIENRERFVNILPRNLGLIFILSTLIFSCQYKQSEKQNTKEIQSLNN